MMNPSQPPMAPVCCLCQTVFREPKVLPCLHTFCSSCLKNLVKDEPSSSELTCPTCGCVITLPYTGVPGLVTNALVKRLAEPYFEEMTEESQEGSPESVGQMTRSETWPLAQTRASTIVSSKTIGDGGLSAIANLEAQPAGGQPQQMPTGQDEAETKAHREMKTEACRVSSKLMSKLMHLQGEALRITYSIDTVNQTVHRWREQNAEIKAQIEDRSMMLQHLIKRHEQKLLAQVDNLENRNEFLNEADRTKTDLRVNLKRVLNAVEFLRQMQSIGQDQEIVDMKDFLLGDLKILTGVETNQKEYTLNLPTVTSFENLDNEFGNLQTIHTSSVVFEPETADASQGLGDMKLTQEEKAKQMEFTKASRSRLRRQRRAKTQQIRFSSECREPRFDPHRRATRIITSEDRDLAMEKSSPEDAPEDIKDLQETLKYRRRELIQNKQLEDDMQQIHEVQLLSTHRRPTRDKKRRVQSFGGRASSRTRLLEQAARNVHIRNENDPSKSPGLDKSDSFESTEGDAQLDREESPDDSQPPADDMTAKLKYLRDKWSKRREMLKTSESLPKPTETSQTKDDGSPVSPASPTSPKMRDPTETKFEEFRNRMSSIRSHYASRTTNQDARKEGSSHQATRSMSDSSAPILQLDAVSRTTMVTGVLSSGHHNGYADRQGTEEQVFKGDASTSDSPPPPGHIDSGGLTRNRMMQIRANAREKKERWRSQTLS